MCQDTIRVGLHYNDAQQQMPIEEMLQPHQIDQLKTKLRQVLGDQDNRQKMVNLIKQGLTLNRHRHQALFIPARLGWY